MVLWSASAKLITVGSDWSASRMELEASKIWNCTWDSWEESEVITNERERYVMYSMKMGWFRDETRMEVNTSHNSLLNALDDNIPSATQFYVSICFICYLFTSSTNKFYNTINHYRSWQFTHMTMLLLSFFIVKVYC